MLKGHVQIDLHNHKSGFKERYEQDNLITNATKYMLGNCLNMKANPTNLMLPLSTYGLGGIFLFDGPLEENPENIHFPSNVHLIGHAGQSQNTSQATRGSIDTLESYATDTGFQNVWDFNTSQGNGTIASLALTNRVAGDHPFEHATTASAMSNNFTAEPITYDDATQMLYYRSDNHIYKTKMPNEIVRVNDPYYGFTKYGADQHVCDISLSKGSYYYWESNDGHDGYMYVMYADSNSSGDATFYYKRYRISDFSFAEEPEQVLTLKNIQLSYQGPYYTHAFAVASKGFFYIRGRDSKRLYIVEIGNPANIKEVDFNGATFYDGIRENYEGGVVLRLNEPYQASSRYVSVFVYPDGKMVNLHATRNTQGAAYFETDHLTGFHFVTGSYAKMELILTPWYLGSICNLDTPVIKTPSTDMKITYTLTNVG